MKTRVTNGIMGTFRFDAKGDICPNQTISFYRLVGKDRGKLPLGGPAVNAGC